MDGTAKARQVNDPHFNVFAAAMKPHCSPETSSGGCAERDRERRRKDVRVTSAKRIKADGGSSSGEFN